MIVTFRPSARINARPATTPGSTVLTRAPPTLSAATTCAAVSLLIVPTCFCSCSAGGMKLDIVPASETRIPPILFGPVDTCTPSLPYAIPRRTKIRCPSVATSESPTRNASSRLRIVCFGSITRLSTAAVFLSISDADVSASCRGVIASSSSFCTRGSAVSFENVSNSRSLSSSFLKRASRRAWSAISPSSAIV